MMRLMIADDEPIITNGLFEFFTSQLDETFDILKATSGMDALEQCKHAKIDILLSDICMPDISGLELQKQVLQLWPNCKVIFLTGFNDFDYIQNAIRNKSVDYILKTEGDEVILAAVLKAKRELDKEAQQRNLLINALKERTYLKVILRQRLLQHLASGKASMSEALRIKFSNLSMPLNPHHPVLLLLARVNTWGQQTEAIDYADILAQIEEGGREILQQGTNIMGTVLDESDVLWCIQPALGQGDEDVRQSRVFLQENMDDISQMAKDVFGTSVSLASSSQAISWEKMSMKVESLRLLLLRSKEISPCAIVFEPEEAFGEEKTPVMEVCEKQDNVRLALNDIKRLRTFLEGGDITAFHKGLQQFLMLMRKKKEMSSGFVKEAFYTLSLMFLSIINDYAVYSKVEKEVNLEPLTNIDNHKSWEQMADYFQKVASAFIDICKQEGFYNTNQIFHFVRSYVLENIADDLSLSKMASLLHFNASYFSRLFKSITDINYAEYVSRVKMDIAKNSLESADRSVGDIGTDLGFENTSSFSRFFKNNAGMYPADFKKLAMSEKKP